MASLNIEGITAIKQVKRGKLTGKRRISIAHLA
jgi:hypothetical protein